ncbi:MAG: hypothetical protein FWC11_06530 [Firmicutes bacterium]|nr:hypothetical protein [Bacillota bacterium]
MKKSTQKQFLTKLIFFAIMLVIVVLTVYFAFSGSLTVFACEFCMLPPPPQDDFRLVLWVSLGIGAFFFVGGIIATIVVVLHLQNKKRRTNPNKTKNNKRR